jgi:hypothetical protein
VHVTVKELIAELLVQDPDATVGTGSLKYTGWVSEIEDVRVATDGTVCVNCGRECTSEEELEFE